MTLMKASPISNYLRHGLLAWAVLGGLGLHCAASSSQKKASTAPTQAAAKPAAPIVTQSIQVAPQSESATAVCDVGKANYRNLKEYYRYVDGRVIEAWKSVGVVSDPDLISTCKRTVCRVAITFSVSENGKVTQTSFVSKPDKPLLRKRAEKVLSLLQTFHRPPLTIRNGKIDLQKQERTQMTYQFEVQY